VVVGSEPVLGVSVYPPPDGQDASGGGLRPAPAGARRPLREIGYDVLAGERTVRLPRHRLAEPFEDEGLALPAAGGGAEGEA
jgi:hypothetical protein